MSDVNWVILNSYGSWVALLDIVLSILVLLYFYIWVSIDNLFYIYYNCDVNKTCIWEYLIKFFVIKKKLLVVGEKKMFI